MLRKIFVALWAMLACTAYATELAFTPNKRGGMIVITSEKCHHPNNPNHWIAYTTVEGSNETSLGCWGITAQRVFIRWDGVRDLHSYPLENFILFKKGERM